MESLQIVIVGAGIGGLQAALALAADGHSVTVLEAAKAFEEVGAGIRVPPNSSRLSLAWGVDFSKIKKNVSLGNRFVDWKGRKLLDVPLQDVEARYKAPYYFLHRADLIALLIQTAEENPHITIRTGCRVSTYDFDSPSVSLDNGELIQADLIIAADGIKSTVRNEVSGIKISPQDTGDVAYRILVPAQPLLDDPDMAHLVTEPWATHWMGPEGHAVGYPLRESELYNIIIDVTHSSDIGDPLPDDEQVWKSARSNNELVERFRDWCPQVQKLCAMTGQYLKWKLADFAQLPLWTHPAGRVVLLGDASHPMMPYLAQGAAQATEDAATLAAALRRYQTLKEALQAYEAQRKPRAEYITRNTRVLQDWLHLHDGPAQEARDRAMQVDDASNCIFWGHSKRNDWLFGHDASTLSSFNDVPELPPRPARDVSVYRNSYNSALA